MPVLIMKVTRFVGKQNSTRTFRGLLFYFTVGEMRFDLSCNVASSTQLVNCYSTRIDAILIGRTSLSVPCCVRILQWKKLGLWKICMREKHNSKQQQNNYVILIFFDVLTLTHISRSRVIERFGFPHTF